MPTSPLNGVVRNLLAAQAPEGTGMTDDELLSRFLASRDDDALTVLVRRHAAMVWGVCRRLLYHHHDAEDAFQATFFVLVRRATLVPRGSVAGWLHGVARYTALRLRRTAARRSLHEKQVVNMPEPKDAVSHDDDLPGWLDEELARLPEAYRVVIALCDLEGMTRKEAARHLAIPEGSVASRLARARSLLARRLARHGQALSTAALATVLAAGVTSASAPSALVTSTIRTASLLAAGRAAGRISARVAALTEGVVQTMFVTKMKRVLMVVLVAGLFLGGIGVGVDRCTNPGAVAQPPTSRSDAPRTTEEKPKRDVMGLLPGEIKRELNRGLLLRVELKELDPKAHVMTVETLAPRVAGQEIKRLRLTNLPFAGNVAITDGKKDLKVADLKVEDALLLQLEGTNPGEMLVVTAIRLEQRPPKSEDRPKKSKVMTIDEALTQLPAMPATVEFKVGKAGEVWATGSTLGAAVNKTDADRQLTLLPAGADADRFRVILDRFSETRLQVLGVKDPQELVGKTIRVSGKVEATSRPVRPNTTGRIMVWEMDQIEVVK